MIRLTDVYSLIESSFDFLLAVDEKERVIHASPMLGSADESAESAIRGRKLAEMVTDSSLTSFRAGMKQAREHIASVVVCTFRDRPATSLALRTGYLEQTGGGCFLFYGNQLDGLSRFQEEDKDERIKELSCVYSVAQWIEVSPSIREFFTKLPDYLRRGMRYSDSAVIHSLYQGNQYGQPLSGANFMATKLIVNREESGEIRAGYLDPGLELLPEEQRMLDEIGRMLSLALERKELSERLALKHEEEAEYRRHLEALERDIANRTHELDEQRHNLDRINTYLERVNRDWEESKSLLATFLKGIPETVALIDRSRTLVMTNQSSVQLGDKCHKNLFRSDTPCRDCRLARIMREKTPITLTIENEGRHLQVHALPIFDKSGEVDGIMEFYRDVTLEMTYQQQLQQADRMASLGQLVSGIGHEINNPNQFIRGNVKILKQAIEDMLPILDNYRNAHPDLKIARLPYSFFRDHVMTLVDDMSHGSERIKSIVEGLKHFARRDEGLLIDTVDINTIIEAAIRLIANEVHKHAEIRLDLDPQAGSFIGNSQKIEQVMVNLIVNSGQAMPDDRMGEIIVRTRHDDGWVTIEVEDNGSGMNESTLKKIFDPFFTTKRAKGGTGLGLAIAYRIVEEHRGTISVRSELGKGTCFTIRFPAGTVAARPAGSAGNAPAGPAGSTPGGPTGNAPAVPAVGDAKP